MLRKKGFILPLTIIIIFAISALVVRLLTRATSLAPLQRLALDREQAKQVALMGVTLAQAQLTGPFKSDKDKQAWYKAIFKNLNHWQKFDLKYEHDGIDAEIQIYISCEQGKIPINALWNFKDKKFIAAEKFDVKKNLGNLFFSNADGDRQEGKVIDELEKTLKNFDYPLEDLTDLFVNKYFKSLASRFLPQPVTQQGSAEKPVQQMSFADIFTTGSSELATLQPLFLSTGVKKIFELKSVEGDDKTKEEALKKLISGIKESMDWKTQWDQLLSPLYGKKYASLPQPLTKLFAATVGASEISVVSYGKVGNVTQKVLVFLSSTPAQKSEPDGRVTYTIKKLYWL